MINDATRYGQKLDRIRRFFLTIFLYFVFGIGALVVLVLLIFPAVLILRNKPRRVRSVRRINRHAFNAFTGFGVMLGVFDISFSDAWRLQQPGQLIIANHPSLLDVVFLLGRIPNANCVVKNKLLKNPFLAVQVYFADYIRNDDGETLLQNCLVSLERGDPVIIFPEGTRTIKNQGYTFKRGAAHLMLMSNCPVRPVYISCEPATLGREDSWYVIPERKITYHFTVMAELDMAPIRQANKSGVPLKSRWLTGYLVDWYEAMDIDGPYKSPKKVSLPYCTMRKSIA